ncbi:MAG: PPOX class F420-dependent oxidoreductase [Actinomycetota bacterium]
MLPESAKEVIRSGRLAHLVTLDPDGSPQVTLAWVGLDGDDVVIGTLPDQRKTKNMRRDSRVAVSIDTLEKNEVGLDKYLVLYGQATVTEGGAPELLQELAYTYIGPGVKFPPFPNPPPGYVTRIAVDRVGGIGPWTSG